jgi:kynurenine formamidase
MHFIDLSHTIEEGMPVYPGSPVPSLTSLFSIADDGFAELLLAFSSHTGTHIDLPSHMISEGRSLDVLGPDRFFGKGFVLDVSDSAGGMVTLSDILHAGEQIRACDFLLLCSGWSRYWGKPGYFEGYPVLADDAARWICGFGLKGIGVDMISVDAPDDTVYPLHKLFLGKEIIIIENLVNLSQLIRRTFMFSCFPLKIAGGEASPSRAVAITGKWGMT